MLLSSSQSWALVKVSHILTLFYFYFHTSTSSTKCSPLTGAIVPRQLVLFTPSAGCYNVKAEQFMNVQMQSNTVSVNIFFSVTSFLTFLLAVSGKFCDMKSAFTVFAHRYVCSGGSSSPTPTDGSHGYLCPAGHSCLVGSANELPCEPGTYNPALGAARCLSCPKGSMCPSSATQEPSICPTGEGRKINLHFQYELHQF